MIGDRMVKIVARCPDRQESYITATLDLKRVRKEREYSRNFQQRRPGLYGEIIRPVK